MVRPLATEVAQTILPVSTGSPTRPAPKYCLVPNEVDPGQVAGAQQLLFLALPADPTDAAYAEQWASARNVPVLPPVPCTGEMLTAGVTTGAGPAEGEAYISSPAPGQEIATDVPIMGTANFSSAQAQYYKFELRGGPFNEWVTLGNPHSDAVINGQLETLGASGLQPGTYYLRLVIVGLDGNYLQDPYQVSFVRP